MNLGYDTDILFQATVMLAVTDTPQTNDTAKACAVLFDKARVYTLWTVEEEWEERIIQQKIEAFSQRMYEYMGSKKSLGEILEEIKSAHGSLAGLCVMFSKLADNANWLEKLNNLRSLLRINSLILIKKTKRFLATDMKAYQEKLRMVKQECPRFAVQKRSEDAKHIAAAATARVELSEEVGFVAMDADFHKEKLKIKECFHVIILIPQEIQ